MFPWNYKVKDPNSSDEILSPMWEGFTSNDFYFASQVRQKTGKVWVFITPKRYYESIGRLYYDSMPIARLLPKELVEIIPCIYESKISRQAIGSLLLSKSFNHNYAFQHFIDYNSYKINH